MSNTIKGNYKKPITKEFNHRTAIEEAARCLLCIDAPCSENCPAGTDPGKFIRSIRFRNVSGAYETIVSNNPLGGSCAKICPYDRLCEKACSKCGIDRPIEIGKLQSYAVREGTRLKVKLDKNAKKNGKKVALIGAGPASLACANELVKLGFEATIFEKEKNPGGMLYYTIPEFRLPNKIVLEDIKRITKRGVKILYGQKINKAKIEDLKKKFDAIFLGFGLWDFPVPNVPGSKLSGCIAAGDFLMSAVKNGGAKGVKNKNVIVIGGGDVAMDCAATAKISGAKNVSIYYRRTIDEAPANINEVLFVTNLGISITNNYAPKSIKKVESSLNINFDIRDNKGSASVKTDMIIFAIGQKAKEVIKVDNKKVFSGGDYVNGGKTAVEAVYEGKLAAYKIMKKLVK